MFPALIKIAAAGCNGPVKIELLKGEGQLIDIDGQRSGVHCCIVSLTGLQLHEKAGCEERY